LRGAQRFFLLQEDAVVTARPVRVLVVDDSAFARKIVREVLSSQEGLEVVGIARDGLDALERIAELAPDVVTLDLVMPNLDGVGVLRALQGQAKPPAVVIVSMADEESELGVAALELGAFDVVRKPTALATDQLYELGDELRAKVLLASGRSSVAPRRAVARAPTGAKADRARLLLVGASTGGPQALSLLMRALPQDFPIPIAVVLHMPEGYTESFARRVNSDCELEVMEAYDGLPMKPGRAIVARAGVHLVFQRKGEGWGCKLDALPLGLAHRPAVDVMFRSGAALAGAGVLGVVLTGMGSDGLAGSRAIREVGGQVLTEAESSCVVYGMPRSVFDAGLSNAVAPIESMAALILQHL
jgi:two-component system chemotaxis response regulator CheB